jgi:hypothetical protein
MAGGLTTNANPRNLSIGGGSNASPQTHASFDVRMGDQGMLRVISNEQMVHAEQEEARIAEEARKAEEEQKHQGVAGYIRQRYYDFRRDREVRGVSDRLVESLRSFKGQYTPNKLSEIQKFGGSQVFSRLVALKCRGATAMLRDIYLAGERPWFIEPTPRPTLPEDINESILELVNTELAGLEQAGEAIDESMVQKRVKQLSKAAEKAAFTQAMEEAEAATKDLDDMLVEGGFYESFVEFLHNLSVFPFAFMKGPVVKMATDVKWENGKAVVKDLPKMFWTAPSPFDIYWQTGIDRFENADVIEHIRLSRSQINDLLGVPGYDEEAIRQVLRAYGTGGLSNWIDYTDTERARLESREDPHINRSDLIDTLEWHGTIQGQMLLEAGYNKEEIPDPDKEYFCTAWLIDQWVIKVQIDPNPRKRHPYYQTSFEKVPGAIVGHGLPETLHDVTEIANASLRALVNNLSIASGPQVIVNDDRVSPNTDSDDLYPWKRWHVMNDPMGSAEPAVSFFQPNSNSQELMSVYQNMTLIADEISSIPRYMTGSPSGQGGAGRTASGLSMLMENAGKVLQSVAANIDTDIFSPLLQRLYDTVLLTDESGRLRGDEQVRVRGVVFANQRETERARLLEFMQLTANPIDTQIVGMEGRAEMLREVADRIGLDHVRIVPDKDQVAAQQGAQQNTAMQQGALPQPGGMPPAEAGNVEEGLKGQSYGPGGQAV